MADIEFRPWPKIGRLNKDMVVTEKLDGTNAAVGVTADGQVYAQSRTRIITPGDDNFGFAAWVAANTDRLRELGEGLHFGEWWGRGIQRGYGLDERRFSLFNTNRWTGVRADWYRCLEVPCCHVVPVLRRYTFDSRIVEYVYCDLKQYGSVAAPGFDNPEGVVVYHAASGTLFKLSDAKVQP